MVDGHEIMTGCEPAAETPCVIVDLDGTLLRGNSLRMFIKFLAGRLRARGLYVELAKLLGLLAARKSGLISHVSMKYPIHRMGARLMSVEELSDFADSLTPSLNTGLLSELDRMRSSGFRLVLATAAPELYIPFLFDRIGFDGWIATPLSPDAATYTEARGEHKRRLAFELAAARGWEIRAVATDHDDDLPLLLLPFERRMLVSPTSTLRSKLDAAGLAYEVL